MSNKVIIDLGCGATKDPAHIGIDIVKYDCVDVVWDLNKGIPLPADMADEIRAFHVLEHLKHEKQTEIMDEIWRVLKDGGLFKFEVPSTDGRNAFLPGHTSFWNELSFSYFVKDSRMNEIHKIHSKFELVKLETRNDDEHKAAYVAGELKAVK